MSRSESNVRSHGWARSSIRTKHSTDECAFRCMVFCFGRLVCMSGGTGKGEGEASLCELLSHGSCCSDMPVPPMRVKAIRTDVRARPHASSLAFFPKFFGFKFETPISLLFFLSIGSTRDWRSFLAQIFPEPRPTSGFEWVTGTKLTKNEWVVTPVTFSSQNVTFQIRCDAGAASFRKSFFSTSKNVTFFLELGTNVKLSSHPFSGFDLEETWVQVSSQVMGSRWWVWGYRDSARLLGESWWQKNWGAIRGKKLYRNRRIVVEWTPGVWEHMDSWLGAQMGSVLEPNQNVQSSKNVFAVTTIAFTDVHLCTGLLQLQVPAQSLIGSPGTPLGSYMYTYMYMHIYVYICIYNYIYIHIY